MILVSSDIKFMHADTHEGSLGRGVKRQWRYDSDTQSVVGFSAIPECVNLNDREWLFRVKFCFRAGLSGFQDRGLSKIIARKLIKIDTYYQRRKSSVGTLVSGNIDFTRIFAWTL